MSIALKDEIEILFCLSYDNIALTNYNKSISILNQTKFNVSARYIK